MSELDDAAARILDSPEHDERTVHRYLSTAGLSFVSTLFSSIRQRQWHQDDPRLTALAYSIFDYYHSSEATLRKADQMLAELEIGLPRRPLEQVLAEEERNSQAHLSGEVAKLRALVYSQMPPE
ncbi:hypothetical protein HYZ97_01820 [Candidatus Pacearchaeota archaeon]|nr:hypothetical protein [Candidatus Pacearchaeota archaeon]